MDRPQKRILAGLCLLLTVAVIAGNWLLIQGWESFEDYRIGRTFDFTKQEVDVDLGEQRLAQRSTSIRLALAAWLRDVDESNWAKAVEDGKLEIKAWRSLQGELCVDVTLPGCSRTRWNWGKFGFVHTTEDADINARNERLLNSLRDIVREQIREIASGSE